MSEALKQPRKKLPKNIAELPDSEVAKHLFGKKAASELEKIVHPPEPVPHRPVKNQST